MLFVFDLDDTLILEKDFVYSGFKAVDYWLASYLAIDGFFESAWQLFGEGSRGNIFDLVLERAGYDASPELVHTMIHVYRNHKPQISLLPDSVELLRILGKNRLALITDGYPKTQWNKIKALDLGSYIGKIIVTGDWGREFWKPHTRAFIEVSKEYSGPECIYIGDNPSKDFDAPRLLNWSPSIRIRRSGSQHEAIATPPWCREITTLSVQGLLFCLDGDNA